MKELNRRLLAALLSFALAFAPLLSASAGVDPPPGVAVNGAGATPGAMSAIAGAGSTAPFSFMANTINMPNTPLQVHQNDGCDQYGPVILSGLCNIDIIADHFGVQSFDASQATVATLGGTVTVGDQIGWQIGAAHSYITVAAGDNSTTVLNKLASALQGGALTATIAGGAAGGYTNGDVVTLAGVSSTCPTPPAFTLTVSGGNVTAAAIAGAGGSSIMGGYCTSTPSGGPFAITGGTGTGLTLNVTFASPAIAQAMLTTVADAYGFGYTATANIQGSTIQFDFPYFGTSLLTCASGGTGSGCPGSPTETISVAFGNLDNGPFAYLLREVPGRTPEVNDGIGFYLVEGQSAANSGTDTEYGAFKVRVGTVSPTAPEGVTSMEGATNGNKGSLPLMSCLGSKGCWVESGTSSNPNQAYGTSRGGFGANSLQVRSVTSATVLGTDGSGNIKAETAATPLKANPSNPSGTTSTSGVMMGLGSTCKITPLVSTTVTVTFNGTLNSTVSGDGVEIASLFGTGTAPANGVAATGSNLGGSPIYGTVAASSQILPFSITGSATVTPGTAYWFDLDVAAYLGGTGSVANLSCSAAETR